MKINKVQVKVQIILIFASFFFPISAIADINATIFDDYLEPDAILTSQFQNSLYFGKLNQFGSARANLGYDLILFSVFINGSRDISLGFSAMAHIYLFPEKAIFHVDNFYAVFGPYFQSKVTNKMVVRLYPFYHLSAHIADGYMTSGFYSDSCTGIMANDKKSVSNEKVMLAIQFDPFKWVSIVALTGVYFHTCSRKNLKGIAELDLALTVSSERIIMPFLEVKNQLIFEEIVRYGIDGRVGAKIKNHEKYGLDISLRFFKVPHPGSYFFLYEYGYGLDIRFLL